MNNSRSNFAYLTLAILCFGVTHPVRASQPFLAHNRTTNDSASPSSAPAGDNLVGGAVNSGNRHGTYVDLEIGLTAKGVPVKVEVSTGKPDAKAGYYQRIDIPQLFKERRRIVFSDTVSKKNGSGQLVRSFTARIPNLLPKTTYYYALQAPGDDGGASIFTGEFSTLVRVGTVFINQLHVTDDSDLSGSGELRFSFFIGKKFKITLPTNGPAYKILASGESLDFPGKSFFISVDWDEMLAPQLGVILRTTGYDDDQGLQSKCGTGGLTNPNMANGSNDCGEWSTGTKMLVFTNNDGTPLKSGPGEEFTVPFTLVVTAGSGSAVAYEVTGSFRVFYV